MSIDTWITPDGDAARKIVRVEFEEFDHLSRLRHTNTGWELVSDEDDFRCIYTVSDRAALSLLRDFAREWLAGYDCWIEIAQADGDIDCMRFRAFRSTSRFTSRPFTAAWVDEYDAAIVAAVLAMAKEQR